MMKDALIFVDTNILLDFYRIAGRDTKLSILELINNNHDRIITTRQVEMEFKKNRQKPIVEAMKSLKENALSHLQPPAFLKEAKPTQMIDRHIDEIKRQKKRIRRRLERILHDPAQYDPIWQCLQRLFQADCDWRLFPSNEAWDQIGVLAKERFFLGYPPRKAADTSCGDAVNWEWIVHCAAESKRDVIIVSRDQDYGQVLDDKPLLNDWLQCEFKGRVSKKRRLVLTNRLTSAFQMVTIETTEEQVSEEESIPPGRAESTEDAASGGQVSYSGVPVKIQMQYDLLRTEAKCSRLLVEIERLRQAIEECEDSPEGRS